MSVAQSPSPSSSSSRPSTSNTETANTALVETQLLSELKQAAEDAMVPIPVDDTTFLPVAQVKTADPSISSKKRKLASRKDGSSERASIRRQERIAETMNSHTQVKELGKSSFAQEKSQEGLDSTCIEPEEPVVAISKHRRFESDVDVGPSIEIIDPTAPNGKKGFEDDDEKEQDDDDSDAPEAMTAAAGFEALRSTTLDAARTAKIQKSALRVQRRDKDARLKSQAQAVRSQKPTKTSSETRSAAIDSDEEREARVTTSMSASKTSKKGALPALLPDELLATEPVTQSPQVVLPISRHTASQKTTLFHEDQGGPKDVKRGNKIIRVLQVQQTTLPPKSSATSKSTREQWLLGQRGFLGAASVPRRKPSGGFTRR